MVIQEVTFVGYNIRRLFIIMAIQEVTFVGYNIRSHILIMVMQEVTFISYNIRRLCQFYGNTGSHMRKL